MKTFEDVIDRMIELNTLHRFRSDSFTRYRYSSHMNKVDYAIDFCTIRCDIGRCTGKTEYILNSTGKDDLICCHNLSFKRRFDRVMCDVFTIEELMVGHRWIGRPKPRYNTIFIDEPKMIFGHTYDEKQLYDLLVVDDKQTFIMLGR